MRNDPLIKVEEPRLMYGPLPGGLAMSRAAIDIESLDRMAEMVPRVIERNPDYSSEEAFKKGVAELSRFPRRTALQKRFDLLGLYDSLQKTITIDSNKIEVMWRFRRYGKDLYFSPVLEDVIRFHEESHALHHLATDSSKTNRIWEEFSHTPSCLLEILAQLFTHELVNSDKELESNFLGLEKLQPVEYRLWRLFKHVPKEQLYWIIRDEPGLIERLLKAMGFIIRRETEFGCDMTRVAREICHNLHGPMSVEDISRVVHNGCPIPANCYPGKTTQDCFEVAFFFSLTTSRNAYPKNGQLSFRQMFEALASHMRCQCGGITKQVFIFTDNWDCDVYDEFEHLFWVSPKVEIRVYMITLRGCSRIRI